MTKSMILQLLMKISFMVEGNINGFNTEAIRKLIDKLIDEFK